MPKIKLEIELEVPDSDIPHSHLSQIVFDAYMHYTTCKHLEDALKWCSKARIGSPQEDQTAKMIYQYHNTWADTCAKAKYKIEVI